MKRLITPFLVLPLFCFSQDIFELCPNSATNGTVVDFEEYNGTLYATGFFSTICGNQSAYVAEWDQGSWVPSSIEISDPGHSLRAIDDLLYIARYEESIDSNWVYVYDGSNLEKLGNGIYLTTASGFSELPNIYDIIEFNDEIYACGEFDRVGNQEIQGIMKWNGSSWQEVNGGLSGNIPNSAPLLFPHAMTVFQNELYVAGNFRFAGNVEVNGLAKWDGSTWSSVGNGFNGTVYSIGEYQGELYAGGSFTESSGNTLNRIAKWNGSEWISPGFGFIPNSAQDFIFAHTFQEIGNELYIGGGLKKILYDDNTEEICNGVVSFDGTNVNVFNGGVPNNDIEAIGESDSGEILFGGGVFGSGYLGMLGANSINEVSIEQVEIFPNPSSDFIRVESAFDLRGFVLRNLAGAEIEMRFHLNQIDLRALEKGFYFLSFEIEGIQMTKRICKI